MLVNKTSCSEKYTQNTLNLFYNLTYIEVDNLSKHMRAYINSMHKQVDYMTKSGMTQQINLLQYMFVFQIAVVFVMPKTGHIMYFLPGEQGKLVRK